MGRENRFTSVTSLADPNFRRSCVHSFTIVLMVFVFVSKPICLFLPYSVSNTTYGHGIFRYYFSNNFGSFMFSVPRSDSHVASFICLKRGVLDVVVVVVRGSV